MPLRIGVLASGRGSNLQAIIDACKEGVIPGEVVVVVSDKKDAHALERARNHDVKAVFLDSAGKTREAYDEAIAAVVEAERVGLICLAGYMRLLGAPFVKRYFGRIINIHPALLPSFPGIHGQKDALEYGDKVSGCTVHFVDEGMDHGPIILQKTVPLREDDTEESLSRRILKQEHKALLKAVKLYAEGKLSIEGRRVRILSQL